jgi:hypothetical protein
MSQWPVTILPRTARQAIDKAKVELLGAHFHPSGAKIAVCRWEGRIKDLPHRSGEPITTRDVKAAFGL